MSGKSGYWIWLKSEMQTRKEETTNWAIGYSALMGKHSIARKNVTREVGKASWAKGEIGLKGKQFKLKFKKVFVKGWTNHGVWKLINAGNIQLESWWKRVTKERNCQSVQTLTAGRCVLFDRKKEKSKTTGMNVWSTMARSDWMIRGSQPENGIVPNFKSDYALIRNGKFHWKNGEVQSQERRKPNWIKAYTSMYGKTCFYKRNCWSEKRWLPNQKASG
jgi:hypothetical protein